MNGLPRGWAQVKLADVAMLKTGPFGSTLGKKDYIIGGIPVINPMHIVAGTIRPRENMSISEATAGRLSDFLVSVGDVILGRRGEMGRCAVIREQQHGWLCGTGSLIVRPSAALRPTYLQRFLSSPVVVQKLEGASVGSTMVNLNQHIMQALEVPVPPIDEQRRIADKLDAVLARVDACREHLDRVPDMLKSFRQAVLAAATSGDLTEDWRETRARSKDWSTVRLDEIAEVQGGLTKDTKKRTGNDEEVPYLRVANVQRGYLDLSEVKTIRVPAKRLAALLLEPGDILFNEGGDIDKLGRGWVWEGQISRCTHQNHVFRARLLDNHHQPKYVSWWGNHRGLDYFLRSGKQTTNLASINKTILCALPISLPPGDEQAEIVRRVESLFAYADRLEAHYATASAKVERLTPALLAKAFRGELVPQDPNDEPASVLLERIRAARATEPAKPRRRKATAVSGLSLS